MTTLRKSAPLSTQPAEGGRIPVGQTDGLVGYAPSLRGGFYPTELYQAVRTFVDAEGNLNAHPADYPNYRLISERLLPTAPTSMAEMDRAIALNLAGLFDPAAPYAYLQANFNVWSPTQPQPYITPQAEIYSQYIPAGWGGGAMTGDGFAGLGTFTFTTTGGTVAAVGLAPNGADVGDPAAVVFGFMFRGYKGVSIIESGVETALAGPPHQTSTTVFKVEYAQGRVTYYIDGVSVRSLVTAATSEMWFGIACLNSPAASVQGVSIAPYSGATLVLPRFEVRRRGANLNLRALTLTSRPTAGGGVVLRGLRGTSFVPPGAAVGLSYLTLNAGQRQPYRLPLFAAGGFSIRRTVVLPRMQLLAGAFDPTGFASTYGEGRPVIPALSARGYSGRVQQLGAMATLPRVRAIAVGTSGQLGQGAVLLPTLTMRSASYASGAVRLPAVRALGTQDPAGEAFISGAPFARPEVESTRVIAVVIDAAGGIAGALSVNVLIDTDVLTALTADSSASSTAILQAVMTTVLQGSSFTPLLEQGAETWIVNAESGATSFYENFSFNSFGVSAGRLYGARSDGIYLLEGDTDDGAAIRASLSFGSTDFKTAQLKRMEYAYIGVASSGTMYLKVKVQGGAEYTYAARRSDDYMAVQRVDVGRGLRASFYEFELYNSDGCDFELNTVEFLAAELTRRI